MMIDIPTDSRISLSELETLFKQTKADDKVDTSKLTNNFTLKGLDDVKEQIATAVKQVSSATKRLSVPTDDLLKCTHQLKDILNDNLEFFETSNDNSIPS